MLAGVVEVDDLDGAADVVDPGLEPFVVGGRVDVEALAGYPAALLPS